MAKKKSETSAAAEKEKKETKKAAKAVKEEKAAAKKAAKKEEKPKKAKAETVEAVQAEAAKVEAVQAEPVQAEPAQPEPAKAPSGKSPLALVIMDGFGYRADSTGNAIAAAKTPNIDKLLKTCPNTRIGASGMDVGLPEGQMGNSEVGHTNIGAGRIVYQELTRITKSIQAISLKTKRL